MNPYTHAEVWGTKSISISDEAYERLTRLKGSSRVSFSEAIP